MTELNALQECMELSGFVNTVAQGQKRVRQKDNRRNGQAMQFQKAIILISIGIH